MLEELMQLMALKEAKQVVILLEAILHELKATQKNPFVISKKSLDLAKGDGFNLAGRPAKKKGETELALFPSKMERAAVKKWQDAND